MNYSYQLSTNAKYYLLLFWTFSRVVDLLTGYVEYSFLRVIIAILLSLVMIFSFTFKINMIFSTPIIIKFGKFGLFVMFTILGYSLFLSRSLRNANMGETYIFKESIENTALYGGWLWNQYEGVSHFAYHNSPGFFLFVPLVWVLGKYAWLLISFLQSLAIVTTNYIAALRSSIGLLDYRWNISLFVALFLATYTQHAKFIDTRFAMLGIAVFIYGISVKSLKINLIGFLICLLFRETAIIPCLGITLFTRAYPFSRKIKWMILTIGCLWCILTIYLVNELNPTGFYGNGFNGTGVAISHNIHLKFAHILRLINFGPLIFFSIPGLIGLLSEFCLIIFATHVKFYSLSWHLWIIPGIIIIMYSIDVLKKKYEYSNEIIQNYFLFVILTSIWQFLTTFHPRLF